MTARRMPEPGDQFVVRSDRSDPDLCLVHGYTYIVVDVHTESDGIARMSLLCEPLDTQIGGVRWDDPTLEPIGRTAESVNAVARLYEQYERNPHD